MTYYKDKFNNSLVIRHEKLFKKYSEGNLLSRTFAFIENRYNFTGVCRQRSESVTLIMHTETHNIMHIHYASLFSISFNLYLK